jgi:hypothetical protein
VPAPKEAVGGPDTALPGADRDPHFDADTPLDTRWNWVLENLPAIGKDSLNKQQGFKYRSIDTVLDHLNPLFGKAGVHVIPTRQVAYRETRGTRSGGSMNDCYNTVTWEIRDVAGHTMTAETLGEGTDSGDKSTSKAQTMAMKYLLWPSLAIAENEDPDGETVEASTPSEAPTAQQETRVAAQQSLTARFNDMDIPDAATSPQLNKIRRVVNDLGLSWVEVETEFKDALPEAEWPEIGINGLTKSQASVLIDRLDPK